MRRESFELTESLLPDNPLEGLDPEPDVLANITARARARRRGQNEATDVTQNPAVEPESPAQDPPAPHIVYFSATLDDGPVRLVDTAGEPLPPGREAELARELNLVPSPEGNGQWEPRGFSADRPTTPPPPPGTAESGPDAPRRTRKKPAASPDSTPSPDGKAESKQTGAINRESSRVNAANADTSVDANADTGRELVIDLDDPDLMSGTHATTLRIDWEVIQGLKRIARDLSRPRKECTMGMLILHALKQTYPDLFEKP
jgi:hypothetical protein